jgi:hypothetical protein
LSVAGSKPGKSLENTKIGSKVCIKTPTKESPEYLTNLGNFPRRVLLLQTMVLDMKVKGSKFIKNSLIN